MWKFRATIEWFSTVFSLFISQIWQQFSERRHSITFIYGKKLHGNDSLNPFIKITVSLLYLLYLLSIWPQASHAIAIFISHSVMKMDITPLRAPTYHLRVIEEPATGTVTLRAAYSRMFVEWITVSEWIHEELREDPPVELSSTLILLFNTCLGFSVNHEEKMFP